MHKQKQYSCCCPRRRHRCGLSGQSTRKKKQILQTYLISPYKIRQNAKYELIERQKLQALKRKDSNKYIVLNPNTRYHRSVKTQNQQLQDKYLEQLKSFRKEIKSLKKELQQAKTVQIEPAQDENNDNEFSSPMKAKMLKPIKISYGSRNLNPQSPNVKLYAVTEDKRAKSMNNNYQRDIQQLSNQIKDLRKQLISHEVKTLQRELALSRIRSNSQTNQSFPLINQNYGKSNPKNTRAYSTIATQPKQLNAVYVRNPKSRIHHYKTALDQPKTKDQPIKANEGLRKFRKVVNSIFFCSYLRQFSQKVKHKRQQFFKQNYKENIYYQIALIKAAFVQATNQALQSYPTNESKSLIIAATDNQKQRQFKVQMTRKYLNIFLDIIGQIQFDPNMIKTLTQTCYYVCRHGGAGVTSSYFTSQELDIMCVNKATFKICAQKHLEKSQIISFIWVKLIIFNILLRTSTVQELRLQNNTIWNTNLYLLGSFLYQICHNLQADLIQRTPINYVIGNWKHINFLSSKHTHSRKQIIPCKSMIVSEKPFQKLVKTKQDPNQLIRGTISKSYLSEAYNYEKWQPEQRKVSNFVNFIHKKICKFHAHLIQDLI